MTYITEDRRLSINVQGAGPGAPGRSSYDILYRTDFRDLGASLNALYDGTGTPLAKRRIHVVTDSNVAPLYLDTVIRELEPFCAGVSALTLPAGEEYKNMDSVGRIYRFLMETDADRGSIAAALGGGVIGDMTGLAAATYMRGIGLVQIPTTLLSQADSSIGGKTAVDFEGYKNLVGAFYMPSLVYSNTALLATLEERQFLSGMAEIVKHGIILDRDYFSFLEDNAGQILTKDPDLLADVLYQSNVIKKNVVEQDPYEKAQRKLLNFGHTLGHAIEKDSGFSLYHGECVSIGSICACRISGKRGILAPAEADRIRALLARLGLPVRYSIPDPERIIRLTKLDKKNSAGVLSFILLHGIGEAFAVRDVTPAEMADALAAVSDPAAD